MSHEVRRGASAAVALTVLARCPSRAALTISQTEDSSRENIVLTGGKLRIFIPVVGTRKYDSLRFVVDFGENGLQEYVFHSSLHRPNNQDATVNEVIFRSDNNLNLSFGPGLADFISLLPGEPTPEEIEEIYRYERSK